MANKISCVFIWTAVSLLFACLPWLASADCSSNSDCSPGGECVNGRCRCSSMYYGSRCEHPCYCHNKGTCDQDGQCVCPTGYHGILCGYTTADCRNCVRNGGTCTSGVCSCPHGYSGNYCQYSHSTSGSYGIIVASVTAGAFILGCSICVVFIRIWLRSRVATRHRAMRTSLPDSGTLVMLRDVTNAPSRPPGAPPPYTPSDPKSPTDQETSQPPTGESNSTIPGPTPPYSGPSPLYSGPSAPESAPPNPNTGPTPPYSGPSPPYSGPVEPVIPDKDENDDGDDVPLLSGN